MAAAAARTRGRGAAAGPSRCALSCCKISPRVPVRRALPAARAQPGPLCRPTPPVPSNLNLAHEAAVLYRREARCKKPRCRRSQSRCWPDQLWGQRRTAWRAGARSGPAGSTQRLWGGACAGNALSTHPRIPIAMSIPAAPAPPLTKRADGAATVSPHQPGRHNLRSL
jgi:hypothetical protein